MCRIVTRRIPLAILALAFAAGPLSAQLNGLVRRAAGAATSTNGKNATITVPEEQRITPATLDQLELGLAAQLAALNEAKQDQAKMKSPQAYQQCQNQQVMSPDMQASQKIWTDAMAAANGNTDKITLATQKYSARTDSLVDAKCGHNPAKTQDRAREASKAAEVKGQKASRFSTTLWAIFKERMGPFCNEPASKRGNGDVRAEGQYVYLKSEADALAPRCAKLMAALNATS
jgi:hypothetical protein